MYHNRNQSDSNQKSGRMMAAENDDTISQKIGFLGTGSAFASTHTTGYFFRHNDLFLIDLSMKNMEAAKELSRNCHNIYVLLTHMHSDHSSGIAEFCEWNYYIQSKVCKIIAAGVLSSGIRQYMKIVGVPSLLYELIPMVCIDGGMYFPEDPYLAEIVYRIVPTIHTPELEGYCFGFVLNVDGTRVVYTGDTATLKSFLPWVTPGCQFYTEMSFHHGVVHLLWEEQKKVLYALADDMDIYLIHMDDEEALRNAVQGTNISIAQITYQKGRIDYETLLLF